MLLIMLFVVVARAMVPFVGRSMLLCTALLPIRTGTLALPYHSNQYITHYALRGSDSNYGSRCGAFCVGLGGTASTPYWFYGSVLSFKTKYVVEGCYPTLLLHHDKRKGVTHMEDKCIINMFSFLFI